jgi:hypothetical protein
MIESLGGLWAKLRFLLLHATLPLLQAGTDLLAVAMLMIGQDMSSLLHEDRGLLKRGKQRGSCR